MESLPEVLTTREVVALLRTNKNTICQMAADGRLPGRKVGNAYRFSRSAVLQWLQQQGADVRAAQQRRR